MEGLSDARVLVLGLGISGRSAAAFCAEQGARVTAADERPLAGVSGLPASVQVRLGEPFPDPTAFDLVVPSPGVPRERYAARARRVWGDLELAFRSLPIPIAAVTGTNGKSTTVRLLEAMLGAAGIRAMAAGNVGEPALGLVGLPLDVAVLEVSSFQLEAIEAFRPRVAIWLNVSADHLDRHGDLDAYVAAKARLFSNQGADDIAVLNGDDRVVCEATAAVRSRVLRFRSERPVDQGGWIESGVLALRLGETTERFPLEPATHLPHRANLLAALVAAAALGADPAKALAALVDFRPLPHRCELIRRLAGVTFVNDSKATNPAAAVAALTGQTSPVVWIAGGRDKGVCYAALAEAAQSRVRTALLIGEATDALAEALGGSVAWERAGDLEAAVARAQRLAQPGDVVLLSPACSSFDQFANFEERGERFRAAVNALAGGSR